MGTVDLRSVHGVGDRIGYEPRGCFGLLKSLQEELNWRIFANACNVQRCPRCNPIQRIGRHHNLGIDHCLIIWYLIHIEHFSSEKSLERELRWAWARLVSAAFHGPSFAPKTQRPPMVDFSIRKSDYILFLHFDWLFLIPKFWVLEQLWSLQTHLHLLRLMEFIPTLHIPRRWGQVS